VNLNTIVEQCADDSRRWFPTKSRDLTFLTVCAAGELGEFANVLKKIERGTTSTASELLSAHAAMGEELTDLFIYTCVLADALGVNLEDAYRAKRAFNQRRFGAQHDDAASGDAGGS
jgi:NTP pyrophosphatase (non-canonical NTP hydrolase)